MTVMKKMPTYYSIKASLALIAILCALNSFGQTYTYTFKIPGITNPAEAKDITPPLRRLFNDPANPYATYPSFINERDEFHFNCPLVVSREHLEQTVAAMGLTLTDFTAVKLLEGETYNPNEH